MTETLLSLISILMGIIGANITGIIFKKYTFGIIGNTIIGVFGSIFLIKGFGRLRFDPWSIMTDGEFNGILFSINILVSLIGGAIALMIIKLLVNKLIK